MLDEALAYAARGWFVFPLAPRSKVPITPNGFRDATRSEARIRDWWTATPDANIGIDCGRSGLVAVDVDLKSGGPGNYDALRRRLGLPLTLRALTGGGGWHDIYEGKPYIWTNERPIARAPDGLRQAVEEQRSTPFLHANDPRHHMTLSSNGRFCSACSFSRPYCLDPWCVRDLCQVARIPERHRPRRAEQPLWREGHAGRERESVFVGCACAARCAGLDCVAAVSAVRRMAVEAV